MIYLKNINEAQIAMIPKNGEIVTGELSLFVKDTVDLNETELSVTDLNTSGLYYNLAVALPDGMSDGEYEYRLMKEEIKVSCGLLYIGELGTPSQYDNNITYKQYESE